MCFEISAEIGAELGAEFGLNLGADVGTEIDAQIGADFGTEFGAEFRAKSGAKFGADLRYPVNDMMHNTLFEHDFWLLSALEELCEAFDFEYKTKKDSIPYKVEVELGG